MIVNEVITGIMVIIIGYLLGSINSAFIITKLLTGKDIRTMGGGNAGGRNVFREVGLRAAIPVITFDVGKGVASAALAYRLLEVPPYETNVFVLLACLAAVAGHMWSVYLKFTGGNGVATTIGVLIMTLPQSLFIVIGITIVLSLVTRNPVLSVNISLLSLPVSSWFIKEEWQPVAFTGLLILIMILNFIPTARAALDDAGSAKVLWLNLIRRNQ